MAGVRRAGGRFLAAREVATGGGNVYFFGGGGAPVPRALLEDLAPGPAVDVTATPPPPQGPSAPSAAASRVTPAVLFVTVVLAVVLLVSGLLHVLRRLFLKTNHAAAGAGAGAGERHHLQHLFFPANDDSGAGGGLAQAAIDALPEFAYAELSGAAANPASSAAAASRKGKEKAARPFDCAVCLCEFAAHDRLRLLPPCGHAFHVACIDVWLRSSATCPLCRTKLSRAAAAPSGGSDDAEEDESKQQQDHQAPSAEPAGGSVVLPVRLGRFQIADDADADAAAESSTGASGSRIDKRRCYSMGSYQYVLSDEQLLVSVHLRNGTAGAGAAAAGVSDDHHQQQQRQQVGSRKVFARGDSFSVSKIWQWRGSRRLPGALCADDGLPWAPPAAKDGDRPTTANAGQQHGDT